MPSHVPRYSAEPDDARAYTAADDRRYARFARPYDLVVADYICEVPRTGRRDAGLCVRDDEIGGWGSVHRYVATKPAPVTPAP